MFDGSIHWLDNGSEHPHRVAFSVDNAVLNKVTSHLRAGFANAGVQVGFACLPFISTLPILRLRSSQR